MNISKEDVPKYYLLYDKNKWQTKSIFTDKAKPQTKQYAPNNALPNIMLYIPCVGVTQ